MGTIHVSKRRFLINITVVTKRFRKNTLNVYEFLIKEYSTKIAFRFLDKLQQRVELIVLYPELGNPSQKKQNVRSVILQPHKESITGLIKIKSNCFVCLI